MYLYTAPFLENFWFILWDLGIQIFMWYKKPAAKRDFMNTENIFYLTQSFRVR